MPPKLENRTAPAMRSGTGNVSLITATAPVAIMAAASTMRLRRCQPRSSRKPEAMLPVVLATMTSAPAAAAGPSCQPARSTRMSGTKLVSAMYWPE
jgi:hypothetical protein